MHRLEQIPCAYSICKSFNRHARRDCNVRLTSVDAHEPSLRRSGTLAAGGIFAIQNGN